MTKTVHNDIFSQGTKVVTGRIDNCVIGNWCGPVIIHNKDYNDKNELLEVAYDEDIEVVMEENVVTSAPAENAFFLTHLGSIKKVSETELLKKLIASKCGVDKEFIRIDIESSNRGALLFTISYNTTDNHYLRTTIASFKIAEMPGCCGVAISYNAYVAGSMTEKGIGTMLNRYRIGLARRMGYSVLIATDTKRNKTQRRILRRNNWGVAFEFMNRRTTNIVCFDYIKLYTHESYLACIIRKVIQMCLHRIPKEELKIYEEHFDII